MAQALSTIDVFAPYSTLGVGGSLVSLATFNVTDMSERSATLMADDYVKLVFNDTRKFTLPAFSFIWYDSQLFFLREVYRPVPKGNYYSYDMKFVSISNLLNKPICFRRVVVGTSEWDEPEITMNGTLADMMQIVLDSIKVAADRYLVDNSGTAVLSLFGSLLKGITYEAELENTDLLTFTYSGAKISEVLSDISSKYETEWWIQEIGGLESGITLKLHMSKCERTDTDILEVSDTMAATGDPLHPTKSRGLLACEYSQEWTGVPQRVIGFGSDRNMEKQQAIQNEMLVSFGKKLRLDYEHSYTDSDGVLHEHQYEVTDADGNKIPLDVSPDGSVCVAGISTGEEIVKEYDEIYPRCYFRVVGVKKRGIENQIYTVFGLPLKAGDIEMTAAEIESAGLFPLNIAAGETLSVKFETGYLCGREFEVANKSAKYSLVNGTYEKDVNGHWLAVLEIVPDGDIEDGSQIPYGNFAPRPKESGGYEGDKFAIFNMIMPDSYVTFAQEELAQRVYEEITEASSTRPEVKCTGDPEYFQSQSMYLGRRVAVTSELFDDNIIPEVLDHRNLISSLCLSSLIGCTYDKDSTSCFIADNDNVAIGSFEVRLYKGITLVSTPFIKTKMGKHSLTIVKDSSFDSIGFFVSGAKDEGGAIFTPAMTDGVSYTISFNGSLTATGGGRFINIKVEEGVEAHIWTIAPEDTTCRFVSRVTYFTHSLTKPHVIEFKLASSQVLGSISALQAAIADKTNEITNIEQMARTLSRRGFYDAMEMKEMLETLAAEMMVVGVEKNQFAFTMGISVVNGRIVGSVNHFDHMEVTAGYIQHTQEPYIDDASNGLYQVAAKNNIYTDINSSSINDTPDEAYYVAALLDRALGTAEIVLIGKTLEESLPDGSKYMQNENYLLLGILSSEFEDGATSYRVFNRSNGYTQIAGGTITTEQIQDPTRSLIIDFASDPPRIIARNGAKIIGGIEFELTEEQIEDILGRVDIGEIGGENLFRAEDWADWGFRATSFEHKLRSDDLDAGKYVMTGKVYSTYSGCKVLAQYSDGTTEEMLNEAFPSHLSPSATEDNLITTGAGITLDLSFEMTKSGYVTIIPTSQNTNDYYRIALVEVMLQKGDRATAYQPWVNYLTKALQGQTSVAGGLLATSVILLRDGDEVTAGMSGVKDDNILLFGGGSYEEAVNAATDGNDYYTQPGKGDRQITTLLKKDGQGKIGIFKISDTQAVVKTDQGEILIDATDGNGGIYVKDDSGNVKSAIVNGDIDKYKPKADSLLFSWTRRTFDSSDTTKYPYGYYNTGSTGTCTTQVSATFDLKDLFNQITGTGYYKVEAKVYGRLTQSFTNTEYKSGGVYMQFLLNGNGISPITEDIYQNTWGYEQHGVNPGQYYTEISRYENNPIKMEGTFYMYPGCNFDISVKVTSNSQGNSWCLQKLTGDLKIELQATKIENFTPITVVANDGFLSAYNNKKYFLVKNTSSGQQIFTKGLGTSKGEDGELYVSDSFINAFKELCTALNEFFPKARTIGDNATNADECVKKVTAVKSALTDTAIIASS